jgi:excisionase family DNA binding protein
MEVLERMENLFTTAEASEYLKVSELTVRRYIKDGKLKSSKIGRLHRISESALREFVEAQGDRQAKTKGD